MDELHGMVPVKSLDWDIVTAMKRISKLDHDNHSWCEPTTCNVGVNKNEYYHCMPCLLLTKWMSLFQLPGPWAWMIYVDRKRNVPHILGQWTHVGSSCTQSWELCTWRVRPWCLRFDRSVLTTHHVSKSWFYSTSLSAFLLRSTSNLSVT